MSPNLFFSDLVRAVQERWASTVRISRIRNTAQPSLFAVTIFTISRFVLERFPFFIPRVILSQETTSALVTWRRGPDVLPLPLDNTDGFVAYRLGTDPSRKPGMTLLYIHGGGFASGSIALYTEPLLALLGHIRRQSGMPVECIAVDYTKTPAGRYPTSLLECLRAYAHMVKVEKIDPASIVICGDSAGGNLVMSILLCLSGQCTDQRVEEQNWGDLPMPARAVLISPWLDLRPSKAAVYASLRTESQPYNVYQLSGTSSRASKFRDPWLDYIAPEALVQCAQLYSGRIERPRRVRGPASSLVARIDKVLANKMNAPHWRRYIWHPICSCMSRFLQRPLFRSKKAIAYGAIPGVSSEVVASRAELYAPISEPDPEETNPLVNPVLGDWGKVSLSGGMCVVWGKNEELAGDIEAWVANVQTAWTGGDVAHVAMHGMDCNGRLETIVEQGASGLHIWPLAGFFTGNTPGEREYGLHSIAKSILRLGGLSSADITTMPPESPTSMPSDYEDTGDDIDGLLVWKRGILSMGVEPPPDFVYPEDRPTSATPRPPEMPLAEPPPAEECADEQPARSGLPATLCIPEDPETSSNDAEPAAPSPPADPETSSNDAGRPVPLNIPADLETSSNDADSSALSVQGDSDASGNDASE
ncbi:hypothetical protein MCUN1_002013 [Malassezia cuniculi]|uniref:Alpha/beta hydrolase fold-3 domain-containing protein n=1 Tax=Malassezia cuniculi TaxID=948313 RepID=A0AAF0EQX7_9BASI|nr:hypothetical protein MCUN1_002013 [Malassezia cuniculi]